MPCLVPQLLATQPPLAVAAQPPLQQQHAWGDTTTTAAARVLRLPLLVQQPSFHLSALLPQEPQPAAAAPLLPLLPLLHPLMGHLQPGHARQAALLPKQLLPRSLMPARWALQPHPVSCWVLHPRVLPAVVRLPVLPQPPAPLLLLRKPLLGAAAPLALPLPQLPPSGRSLAPLPAPPQASKASRLRWRRRLRQSCTAAGLAGRPLAGGWWATRVQGCQLRGGPSSWASRA